MSVKNNFYIDFEVSSRLLSSAGTVCTDVAGRAPGGCEHRKERGFIQFPVWPLRISVKQLRVVGEALSIGCLQDFIGSLRLERPLRSSSPTIISSQHAL